MLLYIGINGPNGTAGKLVPSITMERTVDLAYRIWREGKLRRIDAKCVEAKFPDGYDGECGWGSGFEGKEEYALLDREWAAREREQNAKRVAAPEMEMTGRGARTRRSAQTAGGPAVGAYEDEDDGGAEIGTDGEFGEEEGRTYLLSREIGNELVKRAYLPDLEGRTPELHDEIAVTGWGENAWYTGTTNFIRAAGPRRLKSDSRHSLSRMGNGTFLISILRSTVQPR